MKITNSTQEILDEVLKAMYPEINRRIKRNMQNILTEIKENFRLRIKESATYKSLTGGGVADRALRGHFGFEQGKELEIVDPIVNAFVESLFIDYSEFTTSGGHFRISGVPADYFNVISLPTAEIINTGKAGGTIPWVMWLLTKGSEKIVDASIVFRDYSTSIFSEGSKKISGGAISRSKIALMYDRGGTWGVPEEFASFGEENWITRIIDDMESSQDISSIFQRYLGG